MRPAFKIDEKQVVAAPAVHAIGRRARPKALAATSDWEEV